jgi:hypothetical protein
MSIRIFIILIITNADFPFSDLSLLISFERSLKKLVTEIPCLFGFHFKEFVFYRIVMASGQAVTTLCECD